MVPDSHLAEYLCILWPNIDLLGSDVNRGDVGVKALEALARDKDSLLVV